MRILRAAQVMTSEDVAKLYEVTPQYLQQRVKRNLDRFPKDFMFRLTPKEQDVLKTTHFFAFTEKGILMAGGLLKSERAIKIHIQFVNYFVKLYKENMEKIGFEDNEAFLVFEALKRIMKK